MYICHCLKKKESSCDNMQGNSQDFPVKRSVACYFCNELLEEKYLQAHVHQCSQVLEKCPYRCGVYVPRRSIDKHVKDCNKRRTNRYSTGSTVLDTSVMQQYDEVGGVPIPPHPRYYRQNNVTNTPWNRPAPQQVVSHPPAMREANSTAPLNDTIKTIENDIVSLKSTLAEERHVRLQRQVEVTRMQSFLKELDDRNKRFEATVDSVRRSQYEIGQRNDMFSAQNKLELDKIHLKHKLIEEWKNQLQTNIENLKMSVIEENNRRYELETVLKQIEQRLSVIDGIESDVDMLRNAVLQEQNSRESEYGKLRESFLDFRDFLSQENVMISALWHEQLDELKRFKTDVQDIDDELKELGIKYHATIFELKSVGQVANECADRCALSEKDFNILTKSVAQLRQDFEELDVAFHKTRTLDGMPFNLNGHLLWKISNFKEKMTNAKENDVVLYSPLFYNKQYGYALRGELHLNGIGKWKGRHVTASLVIVKGEWDPLLDWPCALQATVTLKDQTLPKDEAKDVVKNLNAKKKIKDAEEDVPESSKQHVFIPHAVLEKQQYVKDDVAFLEIRVDDSTLSKSSRS